MQCNECNASCFNTSFVKHIYMKNYSHYFIYAFSLFIRLNTTYPTFVLFPITLRAHILYYTVHILLPQILSFLQIRVADKIANKLVFQNVKLVL